jgi:N-acyl-D-aspartate/D-glutamate deacylase
LIEDETGMKPRDKVVQGGGAATTDPRKPDYDNLFVMQGVDWDDPSVDDLAKERGQHHVDVMLDMILEDENQVFVQPLLNEDPDHIHGMLQHPRALATFSDSGAHVCQEMGSSLQTHMLNYWVRGKEAFSLEEAVRMMTSDNAAAWGLTDRGTLNVGNAADIVLFDEKEVKPCIPTVEEDLPGGARRLVQKAEGIHYTVVNGEVTLEDGVSTGNYAGQVVKGPLAAT